jgi:uncharacterized MAPEG superfamily protein
MSSWSALTVCGTKTAPGLEVVLPPTVITMVFAEVNKRRERQARKATGYIASRRGRRNGGDQNSKETTAVFFFITLSA